MTAQTLRCPGCGAPAAPDDPSCTHCGVRLATVACPSCLGATFRGHRHCPHCGSALEQGPAADGAALPCPRCGVALEAIRTGGVQLRECGGCGGVWLDAETFRTVTAQQEAQAAVLAFAPRAAAATPEPTIRYAPCPGCGALMNRVNFARISGVVVDSCRAHGTWFDRDELRRIVEFVRGGGLEASRQRDRMALEEERRRLEMLARTEVGVPHDPARFRSQGGQELLALLQVLGIRP